MKTLKPYLEEHAFLKDFAPEHIDLIVGCSENVKFNEGEYLFHEGDEASRFYFIREGKLAMEVFRPHKGAIVFRTMGGNDVLGWSWLVDPYLRHFDCRAVEQTRAIALDGACLRKKCEADPKLGYEIMKRFANLIQDELMALRLQLLDIYDAPIK